MENRDSIVRKLNALKAIFEHKNANEAEAIAAIDKYNALMQKYNLTETDLHIKQSGIKFANVQTDKTVFAAIHYMVVGITMVTNTEVIVRRNDRACPCYMFVGTMVDVQYADFLFRLLEGAVDSAWKAYKATDAYSNLNKHHHGRLIKKAFEDGFCTRMHEKLEQVARENGMETTGRDLVVLKNALIKAALDEAGMKSSSTKLTTYAIKSDAAAYAGMAEADKVRLRQEAEAKTKYLEAK